MKLDFTGIIKFNKKLIRQTELKDKKKAELDKSTLSLEKLERQLTKLREKEYTISSKLPDEQASIKLEENRAKQEAKQDEISKKKEKISSINATYQKYEQRYLKLVSEKNTGIIDLDVKISKIEDKIDELKQNWDKAAEKLNENYAKMRKINKDSQEYKDLEAENEKHREVMRNNVITSEIGMKFKNELDNLKNMKRILENGEIIEELIKGPEKKEAKKIDTDEPATKETETKVPESKTTVAKETETKVPESKTTVAKETETKVPESKTTVAKGAAAKVPGAKTTVVKEKTAQVMGTEPRVTMGESKSETSKTTISSETVSKRDVSEVDKVLEKYKNDGFGKNAFGWYFNPWKSEFAPEYDPHNDDEYNEELRKEQKESEKSEVKITDSEAPFYKKVIELLKARIRNIMQRITNNENKRLEAGLSKEEYVAIANEVMEETSRGRVFERARAEFAATLKTMPTVDEKTPVVTSQPSKEDKVR